MQALCYLLYWDLLWCVLSCCLHEFPLQFFLRDGEGDGESGLKEQRAMQVVETVKILGWWESNYWPETTILRLGIDEFIRLYTWHVWHQSHVDLFCSCQTQRPWDCSTWFMGSGDSSLKFHNWCHGCPTPNDSYPSISPWKKLERNAGMPLITQHPHFHAVPIPLALPRNAQPLPSNIRTFVAP